MGWKGGKQVSMPRMLDWKRTWRASWGMTSSFILRGNSDFQQWLWAAGEHGTEDPGAALGSSVL